MVANSSVERNVNCWSLIMLHNTCAYIHMFVLVYIHECFLEARKPLSRCTVIALKACVCKRSLSIEFKGE